VDALGPCGSLLESTLIGGSGEPDIEAVERAARISLRVVRAGHGVRMLPLTPAMGRLLELAGLGVEVEREPEEGKEPFGVEEGEEEAHLGDPPARDLEHLDRPW
jgi:hypothetical protein